MSHSRSSPHTGYDVPVAGAHPTTADAAVPADLPARLARIARALEAEFLGKEEAIRLLLIAALAGEHAVLVGPPGTAKSALVRSFARHLHARYFEYLLTRFTEPNEIFGPVDLTAFREGRYARRVEGMLPEAEIVFLDELFKSNSAILNSLLGILNERRFTSGGAHLTSPLLSCFGASNEIPSDEALRAVFDRFVLRIRSQNLEAHRFHDLVARGLSREAEGPGGREARLADLPLVSAQELAVAARALPRTVAFSEPFLGEYKSLVFQIRAEGIAISDRRAVKLLKLFAASAFLDGRIEPDRGDLFLLRHVWNHEEEASVLDALVSKVVDAHYREHPEKVRVGAIGVGVSALEAEVDRVRQVLTAGALSDVQLFSQLRSLGEIRTTLSTLGGDPRAAELLQRIEHLLEAAFRSGRFSEL